jgi:hypothetical protein
MLAASLRFFSGRFADRTHAYWAITFGGYAMNVIAVPALAFASNWQMTAAVIIAECIGKALRRAGARRSHFSSHPGSRARLGLRIAFRHGSDGRGDRTFADGGGCRVSAALRASVPLARGSGDRNSGGFADRPCAESGSSTIPEDAKPPESCQGFFWTYVAAAGLLACGMVDFPLLAYHFEGAKTSTPVEIPLLYAGAMAVNGLTALLFGRLFDRFGLNTLVLGILISLLALPLGFLGGSASAILSIACWATGRLPAFGHRHRRLDEQTWGRIRRLQWRLRCNVVSRKNHDGNTLLAFFAGSGDLRRGYAVRRGSHVFSAAGYARA